MSVEVGELYVGFQGRRVVLIKSVNSKNNIRGITIDERGCYDRGGTYWESDFAVNEGYKKIEEIPDNLKSIPLTTEAETLLSNYRASKGPYSSFNLF